MFVHRDVILSYRLLNSNDQKQSKLRYNKSTTMTVLLTLIVKFIIYLLQLRS